MAAMKEVPTEELLNFQDFPTTHTTSSASNSTIGIDLMSSSSSNLQTTIPHMDYKDPPREFTSSDVPIPHLDDPNQQQLVKSFWTLEYYQRFFDVNTKDVTDRILSSIIPSGDNSLKNDIKLRPDLYGPFWISVTLVFTIAISGNIANYLQHGVEVNYHWKYDFHLVSYAATTILIYISVVPLGVWGLIKWSTEIADLDGLEDIKAPKPLELVCMYGYSLFIYIPVSILWTIQYAMLQWILVCLAAFLSGSVLLNALMPVLKLSRHKLLIIIGIATCHLLLAAGFMLYFFHVPNQVPAQVVPVLIPLVNDTTKT